MLPPFHIIFIKNYKARVKIVKVSLNMLITCSIIKNCIGGAKWEVY